MIYTDGTIAIKAGSPIVTGTGTQWKKNIHGVAPGQMISIENGTNPINMMIRAVNSDTELVLSFNAPVTLSGAKYSIATTVPDTISDAARTMSANQGYIVYFLQAMQQWMTDTGQVEIELPNGQKVTLEDLKGLASQDWINSVLFGVGDKAAKASGIMNPDNTMWWGAHNDYLYAKGATSGQISLQITKDDKINLRGVFNLIGYGDYTSFKMWRKYGTADDGGVLFQTSPYKQASDGSTIISLVDQSGKMDESSMNRNSWNFAREGPGRTVASRQWAEESLTQNLGVLSDFAGVERRGMWGTGATGGYSRGINFGNAKDGIRGDTGRLSISYMGEAWLRFLNTSGQITGGQIPLIGRDVAFDGSGYLKKSSPIIQIHPNGSFETNDESEGTEVNRTDTGQYHITGILGYNSDGAWGVNGGISVPKDNNGLELVYVADRVLEDGGIIIETCHRQHTHLPDKFQNWRLKEITTTGDRIFYQDGEPCDLPEYTRLDVRVEMPQGSVWNVKQRELAEQMEYNSFLYSR
ncbi:hypothetical protein [Morganella psychrotolerans]|uniref:Phage tail protein C-terminal domain-containing protein n=1 Tax=Morganella psychrotolerans TaxID=368603 RepID=A0A1B8HFA6_9GAMM|nr:hypothetical protein [Morganella psychrotolerans]OBU07749.1 hypothetical protein AYY18_05875 [Morganella psychrotolerans]